MSLACLVLKTYVSCLILKTYVSCLILKTFVSCLGIKFKNLVLISVSDLYVLSCFGHGLLCLDYITA